MFGMMGGIGMMGGFGSLMGGGIFMMLFWVLIIVGVIYYFGRGSGSNGSQHSNDYGRSYSHHTENKARDIARERYARGEISKQELEEILQALRS